MPWFEFEHYSKTTSMLFRLCICGLVARAANPMIS